MEKRMYNNDVVKMADGRIETYNITKNEYENIKNVVNLRIQNDIVLTSNQEVDFSKSFICVEFSESYIVVYYYDP